MSMGYSARWVAILVLAAFATGCGSAVTDSQNSWGYDCPAQMIVAKVGSGMSEPTEVEGYPVFKSTPSANGNFWPLLFAGSVGAPCKPITLLQFGFDVDVFLKGGAPHPTDFAYEVRDGEQQAVGTVYVLNAAISSHLRWDTGGGIVLSPQDDEKNGDWQMPFSLRCLNCNSDPVAATDEARVCLVSVVWKVGSEKYIKNPNLCQDIGILP